MRLISAERFVRSDGKRAPVVGFITYVSNSDPVLMLCTGWEDYSDGYDEYAIQLSYDNGKSWTDPVMKFRSLMVPEGKVRYAEPAPFWDAEHEKFLILVDKSLYAGDTLGDQTLFRVVEHVYDARMGTWSEERDPALSPGGSLAVSFSFPIKTSRGNILVPACRGVQDESGRILVDERSKTPVSESLTIIGRWNARGAVDWTVGAPVPLDRSATTRGMDENVYAELPDGRIAMVIRASNQGAPQLPGYKWLSFSDDDGLHWTKPVPVPDARGNPVESGANGSAFFRSIRNGKLYWIGNICREGEHACGNMPRGTLTVLECREEPFAFRRETAFIVAQGQPGESPDLQLSNFRFYQDRATGDLVIYVLRYCAKGYAQWYDSDGYRYRIEIGER